MPFSGFPPEESVGRGAGLDDAGLRHKKEVICLGAIPPPGRAGNAGTESGTLATFGGFEIAMMAGFVLGAAAHRLPVMIDGFICTAAFVAAQQICPNVSEYVLFGHQSAEPGHTPVLTSLGRTPLLNLDLRLGEGTGAALAIIDSPIGSSSVP